MRRHRMMLIGRAILVAASYVVGAAPRYTLDGHRVYFRTAVPCTSTSIAQNHFLGLAASRLAMRTSSSRPNERRLGRITLSMTHVAWRRQPALRNMDGVSSMVYTYSSKSFLFLVIISQALWRLQSFSHVLLASARTATLLLLSQHA